MKRANIQRCRFAGADLSEVRLTDATIADTDMSGCRLVEAKLRGRTGQRHQPQWRGSDEGASLGRRAGRCRPRRHAFRRCGSLQRGSFRSPTQGADFTRADLSGVQFGDADLEGATFTDAQVEGPLLSRAMGDIPDAVHLLVEDPVIASGNGAVAVLWENPSAVGGRSWLRIAVGPRGKDPLSPPPPSPSRPNWSWLVRSRQHQTAVSPSWSCWSAQRHRVDTLPGLRDRRNRRRAASPDPVAPAARPILKTVGDELLLFRDFPRRPWIACPPHRGGTRAGKACMRAS